MKPAPFGYHAVRTVAEAVSVLEAYEATARPLAGGQSLVPMLNMRLARPDALVDLNGVRELATLERSDGGLRIGATVRYTDVERSGDVAASAPLLQQVVRYVGDRQVRNRGTIGGSLAHGDPTAEVPLACLVLDASVTLRGPRGDRELRVADLYTGSYATAVEPCEVLTAVTIPPSPSHVAFAEMCRRHNDFAVVSVACAGERDLSGAWSDVRIGLGGVADTPVRATAAEARLAGSALSDEDLAQAASLALEAVDPASDVRASAQYRRHLVPVYVRRVLAELRAAGDRATPRGAR